MKVRYIAKFKMFVLASLLLIAPLALASGGGGGEVFAEGLNYLHIKPVLVVNYGGTGKVKYIKAEISLRVESNKAAQEVSHHMPLIRDTLIILISSMTDEQMASNDGKELMRTQALAKLNEVLNVQVALMHDAKTDKKTEHGKDDKAKSEKSKNKNAKDDHAKTDEHGKAEHPTALISDLLFDNLVVQK